MRRLIPSLIALMALSACATGGGDDGELFDPGPAVFISPSGEAFRPGAGGPTPLQAWFAGADTNGDGAIDQAEFRADALRVFRLVDANGNGEVRGAEMDRYEREIAPELVPAIARPRSEAPPSDGVTPPPDDGIIQLPGVRSPRGPGGASPGLGRRAVEFLLPDSQPIASADYDQSRGVTQAEFVQRTDARFRELDADNRGRLLLSDLHPQRPRYVRERRTPVMGNNPGV